MSPLAWVILCLLVQRLAELAYARRNTRRLLAAGGVEAGRRQYPLFILLHGGWVLAMAVLIPAATPPDWWLLIPLAMVEALRLWTLAALGRYWTTRVITLANRPLVRRGPYRFLRHPNYLVVVAEIALVPLIFAASPAAVAIAVGFSAANLMLLAWRIRIEDAALRPRRNLAGTTIP